MKEDFQIGDVVKLKSGSRPMTVSGILPISPILDANLQKTIVVIYEDESGNIKELTLNKDALSLIDLTKKASNEKPLSSYVKMG